MFKILFIKEDDSGMCQFTKAELEALLRDAYETGRQEAAQDFFLPSASIEKNLASEPIQTNQAQCCNNTDCIKSPTDIAHSEILCTRTY
jgi:hypothetical protein